MQKNDIIYVYVRRIGVLCIFTTMAPSLDEWDVVSASSVVVKKEEQANPQSLS